MKPQFCKKRVFFFYEIRIEVSENFEFATILHTLRVMHETKYQQFCANLARNLRQICARPPLRTQETPDPGPWDSVESKVRLQGYGYNPFCSHSSRCLAVLVWQYFEEAFCAPKVRLKWYGFKGFPSHSSHCSGGLFPEYSGVSPGMSQTRILCKAPFSSVSDRECPGCPAIWVVTSRDKKKL